MELEPLGRHHDRSAFDCGEPELNDYLRRSAGQNDRGDTARTFVLVGDDGARVLAYFTLSTSAVVREAFAESRGLPRRVPVALIGRMAVDISIQGQGVGGELLVSALRKCEQAGRNVAAAAVIVDALNERARAFYIRYGFTPFLDDRMRLFIKMSKVRAL